MSAVSVPRGMAAVASAASRGRRRSPLSGLRTPRGIAGLVLVALIVLCGLIPPLFMSWGPLDQTALPLSPAWSWSHPLGTDEVGRDVLARVLAGIRLDTVLVLIAVPVACVVGTALGMLSAVSVRAGNAAQWVFNVILGFPGVVLGVVVTIPFQPGRTAVAVAMTLTTIPLFGRQARVTTLAQLSRDYVSAAVVAGTPRHEIVVRHVVPNVIDSVIVRIAPGVSGAIVLEGALSLVGLGIQPPDASLGQMIATGSQYLFEGRPMYSLSPVIALFVLVLGLSLIGDALNDAMLRS